MTNHTAIRHLLRANDERFDALYAKRAFVHWIVANGVEEDIMTDQRRNSRDSGLDLEEVKMAT